MSERLTAPARSPLRRTDGRDSPLRPKLSKSPIRRSDAKIKIRFDGNMDPLPVSTEADSLRQQAEVADVEHTTTSPTFPQCSSDFGRHKIYYA